MLCFWYSELNMDRFICGQFRRMVTKMRQGPTISELFRKKDIYYVLHQ